MSPNMLSLYLFALCLNTIFAADHQELIATFTKENTGAVGTVIVTEGKVTVDLDISGVNRSALPVPECFDAGMKYHIHVYWLHEGNWDDKIGDIDCGSTYTGGHFDPWQGCGSATANKYCTTKSAYGCIDIGDYECNFEEDPYSCEVGDWSSKYGALIPDDDKVSRTDQSYYEVDIYDIAGMSVVFHCSADAGGQRAMCSPFLQGEDSNDESPAQSPAVNVEADFGELGAIKMNSDGSIEISLNVDDVTEIDLDSYSCNDFEYTVWNDWDPLDPLYSFDSTDCEGYIGKQYDPTRQCLRWSEQTDYCIAGELCCGTDNSTGCTYSYSCNRLVDRYSCAPGDLSGKFGYFQANEGQFAYKDDDSDTLLPPLSHLINSPSSIAIHCPYHEEQSTDGIEILACAMIQEQSVGFNSFNIIISVIISIIVIIY